MKRNHDLAWCFGIVGVFFAVAILFSESEAASLASDESQQIQAARIVAESVDKLTAEMKRQNSILDNIYREVQRMKK